METVEKKRKVQITGERILLKANTAARVEGWLTQVGAGLRGIRVGKNELINWLVMSREATLTPTEMKSIEVSHYDEVKFASWALRQIKQARENGQNISLSELLGGSAERGGA